MSEDMKYKVNDKVTISRGKAKGEATITAVDQVNRKYGVQYADATLGLVNEASIKAPEAKVLTARQFGEIYAETGNPNEAFDRISEYFNG
jgi:hypothetical protein